MKYRQFKKLNLSLFLCFSLLCLAFIIHSCKKDNTKEEDAATSISQATQWYENTYPLASNFNSSLAAKSGSSTAVANTAFDLSQLIRPDWQHTASYKRYNQSAIEMPYTAIHVRQSRVIQMKLM